MSCCNLFVCVGRDVFSSGVADGASLKTDIESLVQQSRFSDVDLVFVFRTAKVSVWGSSLLQ